MKHFGLGFALFGALALSISLLGFVAPASAEGVSYAMLMPLAAMVPAPDIKGYLPRPSVRLDQPPIVRPFQGRPALTRDLEAMAVREALTPINSVA